MVVDADWDGLEQALRSCERVTDQECAYVKNAFVATERMLAENFAKVATVRLVMLSEAPLFGSNRRYFYNAVTPFGAFFHFRDAEAILGQDFAKGRTGKEFLLAELARAGFIILDLFPFALNASLASPKVRLRLSVQRRDFESLATEIDVGARGNHLQGVGRVDVRGLVVLTTM